MNDLTQIAAFDQLASYALEAERNFPDGAKRTSAIALAYCARACRAAMKKDIEETAHAVTMLTQIGHMLIEMTESPDFDVTRDPILAWIASDGDSK